jgi:hypothetical protein
MNILGKHPSILTFPEGFFLDKLTLGLNEAAILFNTDYAFTIHDPMLKIFADAGLSPEKIITCKPTVEGTNPEGYHFVMPVDPNNNLYFTHAKLAPDWLIELLIEKAMTGKKYFPYPDWGTCLHRAIFYCIASGHRNINLYGCNNTPGNIEGFAGAPENVEYWRYHTQLIITIAKRKGIEICLIEKF